MIHTKPYEHTSISVKIMTATFSLVEMTFSGMFSDSFCRYVGPRSIWVLSDCLRIMHYTRKIPDTNTFIRMFLWYSECTINIFSFRIAKNILNIYIYIYIYISIYIYIFINVYIRSGGHSTKLS